MSVSGLDIGVLAKYPFTLNEKLSLFPLLGITYRIMLSVKATDNKELWYSGDDAKNFNALWFKFGGGLDFSFTQQIYLRGEAAYGMRLANDKEQHMGDNAPVSVEKRDQKRGHGLEIKIAAGYRI
jgi:opacity protein-like surface antigen